MNAQFPDKTTLAIELGRHFETPIKTANVAVQRASTILFDSVEEAFATGPRTQLGERHATSYGTVGTTTTFALADAVAHIEGGGPGFRAALMPSGLSAITTLLLALLSPGDEVLVSDSVYGPMRVFCNSFLARMGVRTRYIPPAIGGEIAQYFSAATKLVYLESPGSYTFELQDIPAVCQVCKSRNILVAIDNAWASPFYANPFDWGIDFSVVPLTKHWAGHADVLMGAVITRDEHWPTLWATVRQIGVCVGGDDAYLVLRGLRTASVRMQQTSANARVVVDWLCQQPEVARVLWPAQKDHPQHAIWLRDFRGAAALFSVEFKTPCSHAKIMALANGRRLFGIGYSWGGFESLIMPGQFARVVVPWNGGPLVRINIGLENPADLIADLEQGFALMRKTQ
jgi:cysteine-S-conjugate beta-lyase